MKYTSLKNFEGLASKYRPDITRILSMLPPKDRRQTALFSATFPRDIQQLAQSSLRPGFEIIDTVGETEDETAEKVNMTS